MLGGQVAADDLVLLERHSEGQSQISVQHTSHPAQISIDFHRSCPTIILESSTVGWSVKRAALTLLGS